MSRPGRSRQIFPGRSSIQASHNATMDRPPVAPSAGPGAEPDHPDRGMLIRPGRDLMGRIGQEE
jgi:hypothetical protein